MGLGLMGCALLAAAGWVGWQLNDRYASERPIVVNREIRVVDAATGGDRVSPSVVGLEIASALQAFADAGADPGRIASEDRDQVGPAGLVIEQDPPPTTRLTLETDVRLEVSRAVDMPDLVGTPLASAQETLEDLGATVTAESEYRAGARANSVLRTVPKEGEPAPEQVALVYAEPESSIAVRDFDAALSDCFEGNRTAGGVDRTDALICRAGATSSEVRYELEGRVDRVKAAVAFDDDASSQARARLVVVADGREAQEILVAPGQTFGLKANVAGADEVVLTVRGIGKAFADVVLADAVLLGSREDIDALTGLP